MCVPCVDAGTSLASQHIREKAFVRRKSVLCVLYVLGTKMVGTKPLRNTSRMGIVELQWRSQLVCERACVCVCRMFGYPVARNKCSGFFFVPS